MKAALAVFTPILGSANHYYVWRHINNLLPGKTIVVTEQADLEKGFWKTECPSLILHELRSNPRFRKAAAIFKLGFNADLVKVYVKLYLLQHNVKLIMGEFMDWSLPWFKAAQELGMRFFVHAHGKDVSANLRSSFWQTEYKLYEKAAGIITINQVSKLRLIDLGLDPGLIHVIPCGVEVPQVMPQKAAGKVTRCLAVGRMTAKKAPILTLDAFRRALKVCPDLELDYIGYGELYPAAEHFVKAFGLSNNVRLHDAQPRYVVQQYLEDADIFLQHSVVSPVDGDEEGLPVAILEAMANGLPVVSTIHAGIPEAVSDGVTGYLVKEGDSREMGAKIAALAANPQLRCTMGENAWMRAQKYFSWEIERSQLLSLFGFNE